VAPRAPRRSIGQNICRDIVIEARFCQGDARQLSNCATAVIEIVEHGRGVYLVDKDVEALRAVRIGEPRRDTNSDDVVAPALDFRRCPTDTPLPEWMVRPLTNGATVEKVMRWWAGLGR